MWLLAPAAFFAPAWGVAAAVVAANGGSGSGDLPAFALWSVPPALLLHPLIAGLALASARWHAGATFLAAGGVAAGFSVAWTQLVAFVLGPYILAFSFPVAFCWLAGSTVGLGVGLVRRRSRAGRFSPLVLVLPAGLLFTLLGAQPGRPPDLLIEPSSLASQQDINSLLGPLLHSPPTPDPSTYNPVGVRTVSAAGSHIRVTFHATSDPELRQDYIAKIRASPLVASVAEVPVRDDE